MKVTIVTSSTTDNPIMSRLSIVLCLSFIAAALAAPQHNNDKQARKDQAVMLQRWKESAISEYHDIHEQIVQSERLISKLSESATTAAANFELSVYEKIKEIKNGFESKIKEAHEQVEAFKATHPDSEGLEDSECKELETVASNMAIEGLNNGTECIFQVSIRGASHVEELKQSVKEIRSALEALDKQAHKCIDNIYEPKIKFTDVSKKRFCLKTAKSQEQKLSAGHYDVLEKRVSELKELIASLDPELLNCSVENGAFAIKQDMEDIVNAISICYTGVFDKKRRR